MKKKHKARKRERRQLRKLEERSDERTAEFVVGRIEQIQSDLGDLIPDLQTFNHYAEISWVSYCIRLLNDVRKKYQKRSDGQSWEEE